MPRAAGTRLPSARPPDLLPPSRLFLSYPLRGLLLLPPPLVHPSSTTSHRCRLYPPPPPPHGLASRAFPSPPPHSSVLFFPSFSFASLLRVHTLLIGIYSLSFSVHYSDTSQLSEPSGRREQGFECRGGGGGGSAFSGRALNFGTSGGPLCTASCGSAVSHTRQRKEEPSALHIVLSWQKRRETVEAAAQKKRA